MANDIEMLCPEMFSLSRPNINYTAYHHKQTDF